MIANVNRNPKRKRMHVVGAHKGVLAARLRAYGYSFADIARRCGYESSKAAMAAVLRAVNGLPRESVDELRNQELDRLDRLQVIAWTRLRKLTAGDGLKRVGGSRRTDALDPIPIILKIMERRAKLMGLDAPQQYRILEEEVDRLAAATNRPKADILAMASQIAQEAGSGSL